MRILITGALGQLGQALQASLIKHEIVACDLPEVDVTDPASIERFVDEVEPEIIIHCAAFTDVDACAREPDLAYRVNAFGTFNVVMTCLRTGSEFVHISTNEVFPGSLLSGYDEWMALSPINAYGRSKAAAEYYVREHLRRFYIVRTSWLFAANGRNFVHAILRKAQETDEIRVVTDEVGNPTLATDLAQAIVKLIETRQYGIYHFSNQGVCSRYTFAAEILRLARLDKVDNIPILSREYRRSSSPPPFAALNNNHGAALGISLRPWQEALEEFLKDDGNW